MKKESLILFVFMFMAWVTVAQITETQKLRPEVYTGFGTKFMSGLELNNALENAGLTDINQVGYGVMIGSNIPVGKSLVNVEGGVAFQFPKEGKSDSEASLRYIPASLMLYHPLFLEKTGGSLFIGAGYNLTAYWGEVVGQGNDLDLNNISSDDLGGAVLLENLSHGPEFSLLIKAGERVGFFSKPIIRVSYVFNLAGSEWESRSANLTNSIGENFRRLDLSVLFPLN